MRTINRKLIIIISSFVLLCGFAACESFSIEGTITGDTVEGIEMALTGDSSDSTTTDSAGEYSFSGLAAGTYTIIPSLAAGLTGVTFDPENIEAEVIDDDITGLDFVSTGTATSTVLNEIYLKTLTEKQLYLY